MTTRSPIFRFAPVALALAACAPAVPDSGAGVGFQDYNSYVRGTAPAAAAPAPAPVQGFDPNAAAAAIDRAEGIGGVAPAPAALPMGTPVDITAPGAPRARGNAPSTIKEETGEMVHIAHETISDENDFSAVSSRETIQSDAQRIAENRANYVVVQPKDLPQRSGDTGPNIVEYALATTHAPGTQMYTRGSLIKKNTAAACGKFASPDLAQQDFLARGGPDRDKQGLDPDGDGFACDWDPRPFRNVRN